jgi:RNase P subunit RPR2
MVCQRCRGLLVWENFTDLNTKTDSLYTATRCLNCGSLEDAVVRVNRVRPSVGTSATSRGMVRREQVAFSKSDAQE